MKHLTANNYSIQNIDYQEYILLATITNFNRAYA